MRSIHNQLNAWMDGNALTDLHPMLFIEEISCTPAEATFTTSVTARRNGERLLNTRRTTPTVTITLRILTEDRVSRQTVYQRLVTWASGRELRISDRPGQALHCVCTKLPEMSSVMKWTEPFSLTLSGFEHPFWEETVPSLLSISGSSSSGDLYIPGNGGEVYGEVTVTPPSGSTLDTLTLTVGSTSMSFSSLGATLANPMTITYDANGIQSIRVGSTSAMSKRSGTSADDLIGICGKINEISFTANVNVTAVFRFRGAWA